MMVHSLNDEPYHVYGPRVNNPEPDTLQTLMLIIGGTKYFWIVPCHDPPGLRDISAL